LEGGGTDIDESFRFLVERSGGGDFLVLRTSGTDAYNSGVYNVTAPGGVRADSVATLIIGARAGAFDPFVARTSRAAEAPSLAVGEGGRGARGARTWSPGAGRAAARARAWPSWASTPTPAREMPRTSPTSPRPPSCATRTTPA